MTDKGSDLTPKQLAKQREADRKAKALAQNLRNNLRRRKHAVKPQDK